MPTDPVCGMQVDPAKAAAKAQYQGETYYFCSTECQKQFQHAPHRFVPLPESKPK